MLLLSPAGVPVLPKSPITKSPPAPLQQLCLTCRHGDASFQLHCILICRRASARPKVPFTLVLATLCRVHYKQNTFQEFMPRIICCFGLCVATTTLSLIVSLLIGLASVSSSSFYDYCMLVVSDSIVFFFFL